MSHDAQPNTKELLHKKLMDEEYANLHKAFIGDSGVVTEMTILRMVAHASATMDFIFMYTTLYFDAVQESKNQAGFQVGEASNGFEASTGGL